jgi:predicted HicB family RNase H-like nuclease
MPKLRPMARRTGTQRSSLPTFRTTPILLARAKEAAAREGLSLSHWIETTVEKELRRLGLTNRE